MLHLESFEFDRAQHQGRRDLHKEMKMFSVKACRSRETGKYSSECLLYIYLGFEWNRSVQPTSSHGFRG